MHHESNSTKSEVLIESYLKLTDFQEKLQNQF